MIKNFFSSIAAALSLTACTTYTGTTYTGLLHPESGICDQAQMASLTFTGSKVLFAPTQGVLILPGTIDPAGHITAGSILPGATHSGYPVHFEGQRKGNEVNGTYRTPRCTYAIRMRSAD